MQYKRSIKINKTIIAFDKTEELDKLPEVDKQALLNLIIYTSRDYLKLIYDMGEHKRQAKNGIENILKNLDLFLGNKDKEKELKRLIVDKKKFTKFRAMDNKDNISGHDLKEEDWSYVSFSGWGEYGFVVLTSIEKHELKLDDASIILLNGEADFKKININRDAKQRVIFRFKKNDSGRNSR